MMIIIKKVLPIICLVLLMACGYKMTGKETHVPPEIRTGARVGQIIRGLPALGTNFDSMNLFLSVSTQHFGEMRAGGHFSL